MLQDDKLVPVEKPEEPEPERPETRETRVEENYCQARRYFRESFFQALKTNAALLAVLAVFVARGLRCAWEFVGRYFPWRR